MIVADPDMDSTESLYLLAENVIETNLFPELVRDAERRDEADEGDDTDRHVALGNLDDFRLRKDPGADNHNEDLVYRQEENEEKVRLHVVKPDRPGPPLAGVIVVGQAFSHGATVVNAIALLDIARLTEPSQKRRRTVGGLDLHRIPTGGRDWLHAAGDPVVRPQAIEQWHNPKQPCGGENDGDGDGSGAREMSTVQRGLLVEREQKG